MTKFLFILAISSVIFAPLVADAAISFVRANNKSCSSCGTSQTISATSTAGNLMVLDVFRATHNTTTISDTAGHTFVLGVTASSSSGFDERYYVANASSGSPNTITITFSNTATNATILYSEYSGVATSSPVELNATGTAAAGTSSSVATFTTVTTGDVIVGSTYANGGISATTSTAANYTERTENNSNNFAQLEDYLTTSTAISNKDGYNWATSRGWLDVVTAFKPPAAGGGGTPSNNRKNDEAILVE